MSDIIAVMGKSGNGKTRSIYGLNPEETYVIQIVRKRLPFPDGEKNYFPTKDGKQGNRKIIFDRPISPLAYEADKNMFFEKYNDLNKTLFLISENLPKIKNIVIDDSQYLMAYEFIARVKETGKSGYDKYNAIGANFMSLITTAQSLRDDVVVIFLHHSQEDGDSIKMKTVGQLIDNYVSLDGVFETLLYAESRRSNGKVEYYFSTQTDGKTTTKSSENMFSSEEPNDLGVIVKKYREFHNIN